MNAEKDVCLKSVLPLTRPAAMIATLRRRRARQPWAVPSGGSGQSPPGQAQPAWLPKQPAERAHPVSSRVRCCMRSSGIDFATWTVSSLICGTDTSTIYSRICVFGTSTICSTIRSANCSCGISLIASTICS